MIKLDDEQLALEFVEHPVHVYGVYRTILEADKLYGGHREKKTEKRALLLVLRGQAEFRFTNTEGELFLIHLYPGKVIMGGENMHLEIQVSDEDFEYVLIHYLPTLVVEGGTTSITSSAVHELQMNLNDPEVRIQGELMLAILNVASKPGYMDQLEKQTLFYQLLISVFRGARNARNQENGKWMYAAQEFIHAQYSEPLTLGELATQFDMKPKYFSHLFQKYTGMGPMRYLMHYRLNRAQELLEMGSYTVREVAVKVGYADPYYFSRVFKLHKGIAPSEVRKIMGHGNNPS
ncbi:MULTISPECIES: helix-turn-helix domain-containing protein [Paenibacillus]|uniref:helix-turn-helix domain-containing protein n=1 Tax=Paenibacillus TaxID=44249 RepID=UPI000FE1D76B|nr:MULTISPECIES: AraC family transcriptional regulator [Paenibacillus]